MDEEGFLQAILDSPTDDTALLVYADWLEEQGSAVFATKAEYLRLTVAYSSHHGKLGRRKSLRNRLQQLAATLDTTWLRLVVSRLAIESCQGKSESQASIRVSFEYLCDRRWEDLHATSDNAVRFCDVCQHNVHYCDTIISAREHAWAGHCIAVDLGVIRREDDLEPERFWLGRPSAKTLQREQERLQPDTVSAERMRMKQERAND